MPETKPIITEHPLAGINWDDLLETLQDEKCVLFLGSGAYEAPGKGNIEDTLSAWLDAENPDHPYIRLYNSDGFFLFRMNKYKRRVIAQIKEFYNQSFPETEELFGRLAEIPVSMIFSLTPDNLLTRVFDTRVFEYHSDFYFKQRKAPERFERPTKHRPLIYNLLGNIEEPESMVLTHGDFFDYLDSVFKANSMHPDLKDALEGAELYIFLGLPYEKWYFQLLLRVLSMHSDKLKEVERLAMQEFENPRLNTLYTEEFKIEFYPGDVQLFIGEWHRRCAGAGILKKTPPPDPALAALPDLSPDALKGLVAEAKTTEAMRYLKAFLDRRKPRSLPWLNELIVLQNRYNLLRQREMMGTIYPQDLEVENRQVTRQLLELFTNAQALWNQ